MVRNRILSGNEKGFTLVELLIVVAIIGVLSTIGVPTFRRMIQKAKKSEAKVNLGGLYTSESAFFSEFGGYGNNLTGIGFQVDGAAQNLIYLVGFFNAGCPAQAGAAADAIPAVGTSIGDVINGQFPGYFTGTVSSVSGRAGRGGIPPVDDPATPVDESDVPAVGSNCYTAANTQNIGVPAAANTFIAAASGVIQPGQDRDTPAAGRSDVWTIDQTRTLINTEDGVN